MNSKELVKICGLILAASIIMGLFVIPGYALPKDGGINVQPPPKCDNLIQGPILEEIKKIGMEGTLCAESPEKDVGDGKGRYQEFFYSRLSSSYNNPVREYYGRIYWSKDTGAHVIHGDIISEWLRIGDVKNLGYPLEDETDMGNNNVLYQEFQRGTIYWSKDFGFHTVNGRIGQWVSIGPTQIIDNPNAIPNTYSGRLVAIAIDQTDPSTIYVAMGAGQHGQPLAGNGVWKTSDGGSSWRPVADSLPSLNINSLAIDPSNHLRIYAVSGESGVFLSEDAGSTWNKIKGSDTIELNWQNRDIIVHPQSHNLYLAAKNGVYLYNDSENAWVLSLNAGLVTSLVMNPSNPDTLYAGINGDGIYKTTTGGNSWIRLESLPKAFSRIELGINRNRPDTVYAVISTSDGNDLYRTDNGGNSWIKQSHLLFHSMIGYISVDAVNPDIIYIGGVPDYTDYDGVNPTGFQRSFNGGKSFENLIGPHFDNARLEVDPTDPKIIYVTTDGGLYKSTYRGTTGTWTFLSTIPNVQFYDIAVASNNPNIIIGGAQDNGNIKYEDGNWKAIGSNIFGDGGYVEIDPSNPQILYAMNSYISEREGFEDAGLQKSDNGGKDWKKITKGLPRECTDNEFQVHPKMSWILLASCDSLWRMDFLEPSGDWKKIFTPSSSDGSITRSAVDPSVEIYYAGSDKGRIFAGPGETGKIWATVFVHNNSQGVTDIEIDPDHPENVYASFHGRDSGRVFLLRKYISELPTSNMMSLDITSNLPPGLTVQTMAIDRHTGYTIYAGTNHGVYRGRSNDDGATWIWKPYNNGLPLADITKLVIQPSTGIMFAGTFGRSIYEVITGPVNEEIPIPPGGSSWGYVNVTPTETPIPPGNIEEWNYAIATDTEPKWEDRRINTTIDRSTDINDNVNDNVSDIDNSSSLVNINTDNNTNINESSAHEYGVNENTSSEYGQDDKYNESSDIGASLTTTPNHSEIGSYLPEDNSSGDGLRTIPNPSEKTGDDQGIIAELISKLKTLFSNI